MRAVVDSKLVDVDGRIDGGDAARKLAAGRVRTGDHTVTVNVDRQIAT